MQTAALSSHYPNRQDWLIETAWSAVLDFLSFFHIDWSRNNRAFDPHCELYDGSFCYRILPTNHSQIPWLLAQGYHRHFDIFHSAPMRNLNAAQLVLRALRYMQEQGHPQMPELLQKWLGSKTQPHDRHQQQHLACQVDTFRLYCRPYVGAVSALTHMPNDSIHSNRLNKRNPSSDDNRIGEQGRGASKQRTAQKSPIPAAEVKSSDRESAARVTTDQNRNANQAGSAANDLRSDPGTVNFGDFCDSVAEFSNHSDLALEAFSLFQRGHWHALESLFKEHSLNGGWPPNRGAISSQEISLTPGQLIDRYGGFVDKDSGQFRDLGTFAAKAGEPFANRALPSETQNKPYKRYEVLKPIPKVQAGQAIPWFGQPGKGVQYELPLSVEELIEHGYLKEIYQ